MSDETQTCACCAKSRPVADFLTSKGRATTYCESCREVRRRSNRAHRERIGSAGTRAAHLMQKYKITPAEYDALRAAQDYRCAICQVHESEIRVALRGRPKLDGSRASEPFRLVVDHCHTSGRVRGLLCPNCNTAVGMLQESPELIRATLAYVEQVCSVTT